MAIKSGNHRISVTLDTETYGELQVLAEDLGGKSVSKAAAHAVRMYVDAQDMVIDLRRALDLMAGDLVRMCYHKRDWLSVRCALRLRKHEGNETSYAIELNLPEGGTYREAYLKWCSENGYDACL